MSLEMACVYFSDGECTKFSEPGYVSYCSYAPCGYEKLSNGDKIRAMTDEELADFLCDIGECDRRCPAKIGDCIFSDSTCRGAWNDWLTQEAKDG